MMDEKLLLLKIIVILSFIAIIISIIRIFSAINYLKLIKERKLINDIRLELKSNLYNTLFTILESASKVMDDRYVKKSEIEDILRDINNKDLSNKNETIKSDNSDKGELDKNVQLNICDACAKEDCIFYCTTGRSKCNYFIPKSCKTCGTKKCYPKGCLTATKALYWTSKQSVNDIDKYDKMDYKEAIETLSGHRKHWERLLKDHICSVEEGSNTIKAFDISIDLMRLAITQLENEKSNNEVIK